MNELNVFCEEIKLLKQPGVYITSRNVPFDNVRIDYLDMLSINSFREKELIKIRALIASKKPCLIVIRPELYNELPEELLRETFLCLRES